MYQRCSQSTLSNSLSTIKKLASKVKLFTKPTFSFPYQISNSRRAKRLNLKVSANKGVQVTKPASVSQQAALAFLQHHVPWIEKNAHIWQLAHRQIELPDNIHLPVLNQTWNVSYETNVITRRARIIETDEPQLIYCGPEDVDITCRKLQQWVERKAKQYFTERLTFLSELMALEFNKLSFRKQSTRWGSCSHEKNISINYKLIFFSCEIIDYILIHELAHTQHLNHGKRFWNLVAKFVPDYKTYIKALRGADAIIPQWF